MKIFPALFIIFYLQCKIVESGKPRTERNMPLVAGQLKFAKEVFSHSNVFYQIDLSKFVLLNAFISQVKTKITCAMKAFKSLEHPICLSKGAERVIQKYKDLSALLAGYEDDVFKAWAVQTEKKTLEGLDRPLLIRNPKDGTLKVNFGRDTLASLKEVKYLKKEFPERNVPGTAEELFKRFDDFRAYNNCLDKIVDLYNYLKTDTNDKEYRLFEAEVVEIDTQLKAAETSLTWNSEGIDDYIERVRQVVTELNERVRKSQDNIIEIYKQVL